MRPCHNLKTLPTWGSEECLTVLLSSSLRKEILDWMQPLPGFINTTVMLLKMNPIYANAIDSFRVGCEHALSAKNSSSRKQAILTIFHSIEMLLKERLFREHPLLIYRNPSAKINDDSFTVGVKDALNLLDNIGAGIHKEPRKWIEDLQKRRNRIEHHRYEEEEKDQEVISEAISFAFFFIEAVLEEEFHNDIGEELMRDIQPLIFKEKEQAWAAMFRLDLWLKKTWPSWNPEESDMPEEFDGTLDCPICREEYLAICDQRPPFCYFCNTPVDAVECRECGFTDLVGQHYCR